MAADHDASEAGEEEDKENKAEAVEVKYLIWILEKDIIQSVIQQRLLGKRISSSPSRS